MSRTVPVNIGGSVPAIRLIASSAGNSLPSARMPLSSIRLPSTLPSPVATKRRRLARWRSRSEGGMTSSASSDPTASSAVRPNMRSAARLNSTMSPLWSIVMIASREEANTAVLRASLWRTASAAASPSMNSPISDPSALMRTSRSGSGSRSSRDEQLDHGHALAGRPDRERQRAAQPRGARRIGARELVGLEHVGEPGRQAALPDRAGQAEAMAHHQLPRLLLELGGLEPGSHPGGGHPQRGAGRGPPRGGRRPSPGARRPPAGAPGRPARASPPRPAPARRRTAPTAGRRRARGPSAGGRCRRPGRRPGRPPPGGSAHRWCRSRRP